jgi:hypothetical protein
MILYQAGEDKTQKFTATIKVRELHLSAATLTRFIEFWCQDNCNGKWRVEETEKGITISFKSTIDAIYFKFSEYMPYCGGSIIEKNKKPEKLEFFRYRLFPVF